MLGRRTWLKSARLQVVTLHFHNLAKYRRFNIIHLHDAVDALCLLKAMSQSSVCRILTSSSAVADNPRDALHHDKWQNFKTVTPAGSITDADRRRQITDRRAKQYYSRAILCVLLSLLKYLHCLVLFYILFCYTIFDGE